MLMYKNQRYRTCLKNPVFPLSVSMSKPEQKIGGLLEERANESESNTSSDLLLSHGYEAFVVSGLKAKNYPQLQ